MSKFVTLSGLSEFLNKSKTIFAQKGDLATVATTGSYTDLINKPTIPVVDTELSVDSLNPVANNAVTAGLNAKADKATTIAGYGIADAKIDNGVITLGENTITPLTEHQSLVDYAKREELVPYAKKAELATVATSGSYNDLLNKPYIPDDYVLPVATDSVLGGVKIGSDLSATSAGVLSVNHAANADLATKAKQDGDGNVIVDTYALKSDITALAKALKYKGTVETYAELPTDAAIGDVWNVQTADKTHNVKAGENVVWSGTAWDNLGGMCDMSEYTKTEDLATVATSGSYNDLLNKPYIPEDYELPTATATTLGGIKIGSDLTIASGVVSVNHATKADAADNDSEGRKISTTYALEDDALLLVKSVTARDAVITVTKKDGTSTTQTVNNVAHATSADVAGKATNDASGNNIEATYVKVADINEVTAEEIDALFE